MRFKLHFELSEPCFLRDYARVILSYFKHATQCYDASFYTSLFEAQTRTVKPYSFACLFKQPTFEGDIMRVKDPRFGLVFTSSSVTEAMLFFNAFLGQKGKAYPLPNGGILTLKNLTLIPTYPIESSSVYVRFLSPLAVLEHHKDEKSRYYDYQESEFAPTLHHVVSEQLKAHAPHLTLDGFALRPTEASKKTVASAFGLQFSVNTGVYELQGSPALLTFLQEQGIGSRRSSGFGLFEVLTEGGCV